MNCSDFDWDIALREMEYSVICQVEDWWHLLGIPALLAIPIWLPYYLLMRRWKRLGKEKQWQGWLSKYACYLITLRVNLLMLEGVCNRDYCDINRIVGDMPDFLASLGLCVLFLGLINWRIGRLPTPTPAAQEEPRA